MKAIRLNITTRVAGRNTISKSGVLFFMLVAVFFALSVMATTVHGGSEELECFSTQWPHEKSDLAPDPSVRFGRLENGFGYAIKKNETPRDRVAMYLAIPVGSIHEQESERGYAHYLEHMLFNGTTHFPPGKMVEYFQSIGMQFGADINAYTSYDETVYTIVLPKGDIEEIEEGLVVMSDYARGALLLESEVERERGVILAEKLARDSIEYRTRVATRKNALRGTLLADRQPIGTRQTILSATGKSLRAFYDRWYRPDNMTLVVVGDMQVEEVEKAIRRSFGDMKSRAKLQQCPDFGTLEKRGLHGFYYHEPEAGNTRVSIESHWNKKPEDDSSALQLRKLRHYIATSIVEKRLSKIAEEKVGLLSRPRVYAGNLLDRIGYAGLSATTSPDGWQDLVAVLENTLRKAITYGVRPEERDLAVQEVRAYYTSQSQKAKSRQSARLARQMVRNINDNRVFQSPRQEEELFAETARSLTVEDINATLRRLFERSERLVEITGNVDIAAANPQQKIVQVYTKAHNQPVISYVKQEQAKFPSIDTAQEAVSPIRHIVHQDIEAETYYFEGGVVLNLKKTDFKDNETRIRLEFGPGQRGEPAPGMAMVAESVINGSGSKTLTASQMEEVLAGSSVDYTFSIDTSRFSLSGTSLSDEVELLAQTLHTVLLEPGMRESIYENTMVRYKQMYAAMESDISGAEALYVRPFYAGGNDLFGMPPLEDVTRVRLESIRDWIAPLFRNSAPEISVVGDFDKDHVLEVLSRYFGSLSKDQKIVLPQESITFPAGLKRTFDIDSKLEQTLLTMAWQTTGFDDIHTVRRLNMLASVFEERLRLAVREKLGATYSPVVYNSSSRFIPDYGMMYVRIVLDGEMTAAIEKTVTEIAADLAANGVDEEELLRVRKPTMTSLKDMVRTNRYWLNTVLAGSTLYPEQLQWPTTILEDHAAITASDLSRLAQRYLEPSRAGVAIVTP